MKEKERRMTKKGGIEKGRKCDREKERKIERERQKKKKETWIDR